MNKKQKKQTVGQVASDLLQKSDDMKGVSVNEITNAQAQDYMNTLFKTVEDNKNSFSGNYIYIEVVTRQHLVNALQNQFMARDSCPTPYTDQSVYRYNKATEQVEHIWTVPDSTTCHYLMEFHNEAMRDVPDLFSDVVRFIRGDLRKRSLELNNELSPSDSGLITIVSDPENNSIIH